MLAAIPPGRGYLLGDGEYEANRVYDAAAEVGYQLVAPFDERDTGRGHRYQSPHRLRAVGLILVRAPFVRESRPALHDPSARTHLHHRFGPSGQEGRLG